MVNGDQKKSENALKTARSRFGVSYTMARRSPNRGWALFHNLCARGQAVSPITPIASAAQEEDSRLPTRIT